MSLRLIVRPQAEVDFFQTQDFYDSQRAGLGEEFRSAVDVVLRRITERPQLYPVVYRDVRRAVLRRFPYLLYYVVTQGTIFVLACLHSMRGAEYVESRLSADSE